MFRENLRFSGKFTWNSEFHAEFKYYVLQIADYDVDCIVPHKLKQHQHVTQGQRFSQVRYGSQVDLIVPLSSQFDFQPVQDTGDHVEAGIDPVIRVTKKLVSN